MKRDLDLIRQILLACESHEHGYAPRDLQIEGYTDEQIAFHVHLLGQAGLMDTEDATAMDSSSPEAIPLSVTWDGYEFLEASRNSKSWARAMNAARSAGGMALEVVKSVLIDLATKQTAEALRD